MDYTFVSQFSGDGPKRRRLAKACETCRSRKKRCVHFATEKNTAPRNDLNSPATDGSRNDSTAANTSPAFSGDNGTPRSLGDGNANGRKRTHRRMSLSALMDSTAQQFISDLHPEAGFLERNSSRPRHPGAKATANVGVWVDRQEWNELIRQRDATNGTTSNGQLEGPAAATQQLPRPTSAQVSGLVDVYFRQIHPMLPLIDELEFREAYAAGIVPEPYLHAICIVAAKDKDAEPYLHFPDTEKPVAPRDFCSSLQSSVKGALAVSGRYDRLTLIRMSALISFHIEGPDGAEDASMFVTQAMHHCQTLGLHLGQQSSLPTRSTRPMKLLFWTVWTLDRFNAAINGRPIIMADQDIAIEPFEKGESEFPAFEILLKIAHIMNDVIDFYRPGNPPTVTGWEEVFPGFEEIIDDLNGWNLSPSLLATLHIAYLVTAILSHRSKGVRDVQSLTTPSYVRQTLAAIQVTRMMKRERLASLHALPMLPYAISLALSVSYQRLRQDQLPHEQEDAREDFEACCAILSELRLTFSSSDAMATLAQKVTDELRRAPSLSHFRIHRPSKDQRELAGFATACRDHGEPVVDGQRNVDLEPLPTTDHNLLLRDMARPADEADATAPAQLDDGQGLFEGIDDIFGTYLDPNYPVNLEDLSFLDNLGNVDWAAPGM
ncbi:hypothetical protein Q7P35_001708 [Cladosporium inversicolor]